ncbi:MAG: hypothetical protein R2751_10510 [Bacteroidales bacterium]
MSKQTFSIRTSKGRKDGIQTLQMEGELSFRNADAMAGELRKAGITGSRLLIKIENVVNLDVTFYQLYLAFVRKCQGQGIEVRTEVSLPEDLRGLMRNAGIREFA